MRILARQGALREINGITSHLTLECFLLQAMHQRVRIIPPKKAYRASEQIFDAVGWMSSSCQALPSCRPKPSQQVINAEAELQRIQVLMRAMLLTADLSNQCRRVLPRTSYSTCNYRESIVRSADTADAWATMLQQELGRQLQGAVQSWRTDDMQVSKMSKRGSWACRCLLARWLTTFAINSSQVLPLNRWKWIAQ